MKKSQDSSATALPFADLPRFGSGVGLHRMAYLRDALDAGDWLAGLHAVKVTGSNGKGSVCAMLASIFQQLGVSHGLYISPHLVDFRERIRVDGEMIPAAELAESLAWTRDRLTDYGAAHPGDEMAAFEATTALALHHFTRRRPRTVITEAGIGGRYDSTRIFPGHVAAVTSVDLEHTDVLGDTLELIAYEKADLCTAGGKLVVGRLDPDLPRRLRAYTGLRDVELVAIEEQCRILNVRFDGRRMFADFEINGRRLQELEIALVGRHQADNAAVAVLSALAWARRHLPEKGDEVFYRAVREGLRRVDWPGRFQLVATDPDVFVDIGHSPDAARAVVATARDLLGGRPILLVTGASHDKNAEGILAALVEMADAVICTRAWHKGAHAEGIEGIVRSCAPQLPCRRAETIDEAVESARLLASSAGMTVVVAGGLYLAVEAAEAWQGRDPRALFFS